MTTPDPLEAVILLDVDIRLRYGHRRPARDADESDHVAYLLACAVKLASKDTRRARNIALAFLESPVANRPELGDVLQTHPLLARDRFLPLVEFYAVWYFHLVKARREAKRGRY
jgi:hypothetical protein